MDPLFADLTLARALEGAEAAASRAFCEAAAHLHLDKPIRAIPCAGGVGFFYGPSDPLNAVKGVGLSGPVDPADWDQLESFFREHNSPVVIDLCPLADEAFLKLLSDRGYRIATFETVTAQVLHPPSLREGAGSWAPDRVELPTTTLDPSIQLHQVDPTNPAAVSTWGRVLDVGFADGGEPFKFAVDIAKVRAHLAHRSVPPLAAALSGAGEPAARDAGPAPTTSLMFLATVNGEPAGGAGLSIHHASQVAHFSGAAVLPQFRRRGIQTALTTLRLKIARELGCTLAKFDVKAGSISHHNAIRAGFQVAYTRPQMIRDW